MTVNAFTPLSSSVPSSFCLSKEQIETFNRDGVLVIDYVLDEMELQQARKGLEQTLSFHGIDTSDLENTGSNIQNLSSTNGSGGVLDLFYPSWKLRVATNPKLFAATQQLWEHCYCHNGETKEEEQLQYSTSSNADNDNNNHSHGWKWHPYGSFDVHRGYMYMDRIGYRLPTEMAQLLGERATTTASTSSTNAVQETGNAITNSSKAQALNVQPSKGKQQKKKKKKTVSIQRCLTPHLDCCPTKLFSAEATKFRPIQCFVSLTDNEEPNTGGFEAAPGFHQMFDKWVQDRPPTVVTKKKKKKQQQSKTQNRGHGHRHEKEKDHQPHQPQDVDNVPVEVTSFPPPCVGDYTHIRPTEDRDVMKRIQHVPVKAGSAVFWDNRIPHGNAYRNTSMEPRAVVYCSFLPDVPLNRTFVKQQLVNWQQHQRPTDFWIHLENKNNEADNNHAQQPHHVDSATTAAPTTTTTSSSESKTYNSSLLEPSEDKPYQWSSLGRKLIGLDPW